MLKKSEPIFPVRDVKETIAFYKDILGFTGEWYWGDPVGFGGARMGDVHVMFHQQPEIAARIEGHQHHYWCDAIDDLCEKHRAAGADIISPIENKPWGIREYTVRDPNGYHLRFSGPPTYDRPPTALATMPAHIRIEPRKATPNEYARVYEGVGWGTPKDPQALDRSFAGVVAIDTRTNEAVGLCRIMHEGWAWYSIWDVIVSQPYQSQHIGTAIVEAALDYLRTNAPAGSIVYLFTFKHAFYERLGFKNDSCTMIRL
jgi:uncharacterized glyoxalase superfamily protein PhnB/GNAT superfamily N-acetyltransferase